LDQPYVMYTERGAADNRIEMFIIAALTSGRYSVGNHLLRNCDYLVCSALGLGLTYSQILAPITPEYAAIPALPGTRFAGSELVHQSAIPLAAPALETKRLNHHRVLLTDYQ